MKLELKHISAYLPYGLKVKRTFNNEIMLLYGISGENTIEALDISNLEMCALLAFGNCQIDNDEYFKPILRPLSDFTKEIEVNGEKFVPKDKLFHSDNRWIQLKKSITKNAIHCEPYYIVENLFKWHFDVFGLIDKGLAVDINTL